MVRLLRLSLIQLLVIGCIGLTPVSFISANASFQQSPGPSDVVREFYKAMREHRFREAFALTNYKSAFESLTADDMTDLQPNFKHDNSLMTLIKLTKQRSAARAWLISRYSSMRFYNG